MRVEPEQREWLVAAGWLPPAEALELRGVLFTVRQLVDLYGRGSAERDPDALVRLIRGAVRPAKVPAILAADSDSG